MDVVATQLLSTVHSDHHSVPDALVEVAMSQHSTAARPCCNARTAGCYDSAALSGVSGAAGSDVQFFIRSDKVLKGFDEEVCHLGVSGRAYLAAPPQLLSSWCTGISACPSAGL